MSTGNVKPINVYAPYIPVMQSKPIIGPGIKDMKRLRKVRRRITKTLLKKKFYLPNKTILIPHKSVRFWMRDMFIVRCKVNDNVDVESQFLTELIGETSNHFIELGKPRKYSFLPTIKICGYSLHFDSIELSNRYTYLAFRANAPLEIVRGTISSTHRRLSSEWKIQMEDDITSLFGINKSAEMVNVLASDIQKDMVKTI